VAAVAELGAPPDVEVVATDFEEQTVGPRRAVWDRFRRAYPAAFGGAVAACIGVELLGRGGPVGGAAVLVAIVVISAVAGGAAATALLAVRERDHLGPVTRLVPSRYEVRSAASTAAAREHRLAKWWARGLDSPSQTPLGRPVRQGRDRRS
jgi:hypothetical protein